MAIFEWRKFNFFNLRPVEKTPISAVLNDAEIKCVTYGNGKTFIGDSQGNVHIFKKDWSYTSFKAHDDAVVLSKFCRQNDLLVTIGNDGLSGDIPCFKVWNTAVANPICLRTTNIALATPTALGISENGQVMAIGFDKGGISLYKGDLGRDRSKDCKVLSGGTMPITGIAFKSTSKVTQMFVCSNSGVLLYNILSKDKESKVVLETACAPRRCCSLQTSGEKYFMVGNDNAVYCYMSDGIGPCYALEGQKIVLEWFRNYLLTVVKSSTHTQRDNLILIDIQNNLIVFSGPIDSVAAIIIEFGTCYILTDTKKVFLLDEKDLRSKLDMLFKKNLYDIAIRVANFNQYDGDNLAEIFRQYGDHLYGKGKFPESVEQYVKTIGYVEPSYVIRKFLDSRHIQCLTNYLEALHKVGRASADQTTLLLNCFTRLDEKTRLENFLKNDKTTDLMFDLDAAIKVCRNASKEQALELAKRNDKYHHVISIYIEDLKDYEEALNYIKDINFREAEENLMKYGNVLMENHPKETTALLKKVCMDSYKYNSDLGQDGMENYLSEFYNTPKKGSPENFFHLFTNSTDYLIDFLEYIIIHLNNYASSKIVLNTLIENYLKKWSKLEGKEKEKMSVKILDILQKYYTNLDRNHILVLCKIFDFHTGIMWIHEEDKQYHLILRYYLQNGDFNKVLDTCNRLGELQPDLWLQTLTGIRSNKDAISKMLSQILTVILKQKLQSPLQVLNCLAVEDGPQLDSVRDYFKQIFIKEDENFKQEDEAVEEKRSEVVYLKKYIKDLQETPVEFKGTICNKCNKPLSIPAVYFMCQHSYHQDCARIYTDAEKVGQSCSVCHEGNQRTLDTLKAQQDSKDQEKFFKLLNSAPDPFSIVALYFGNGLFNKIVIFDQTDVPQMPQVQQQNAPIKITPPRENTSSWNYGAGAEAKIRVAEAKPARQEIPISEGRMRMQERRMPQQNYSSSMEANVDMGPPSVKRERSPRAKPTSQRPPVAAQPKVIKAAIEYPKVKNPFDDDEEETSSQPKPAPVKAYDKAKDPFAEEEDDDDKNNADNVNNNTYDNRLNPFE